MLVNIHTWYIYIIYCFLMQYSTCPSHFVVCWSYPLDFEQRKQGQKRPHDTNLPLTGLILGRQCLLQADLNTLDVEVQKAGFEKTGGKLCLDTTEKCKNKDLPQHPTCSVNLVQNLSLRNWCGVFTIIFLGGSFGYIYIYLCLNYSQKVKSHLTQENWFPSTANFGLLDDFPLPSRQVSLAEFDPKDRGEWD